MGTSKTPTEPTILLNKMPLGTWHRVFGKSTLTIPWLTPSSHSVYEHPSLLHGRRQWFGSTRLFGKDCPGLQGGTATGRANFSELLPLPCSRYLLCWQHTSYVSFPDRAGLGSGSRKLSHQFAERNNFQQALAEDGISPWQSRTLEDSCPLP